MWKEPELTDEYWYGVWDFIEYQLREAKTVDTDWIFSTEYFAHLLAQYPDMLVDPLNELGFTELGKKALDNHQARAFRLERLQALCREKNLDTSEVALVADRSQWVEPAAVVECSEHDARDLAAVNKQSMLGQFVDGGVLWWSVETDSSVSFAPLYVWSGTDAPCPMSRGPETNVPVKRDGGPGTSRGHAVAAMWADHSAWAHQFMHCQLHMNSNRKQQEKGRGIALSEISPASRRGPMRFIQHVDTSE